MAVNFVYCCYCNELVEMGNNPYDGDPNFYKKHKKSDVCCDKCYNNVVVPRKMKNAGKLAFKNR